MSRKIIKKLEDMNLKLTLMHVCGTHQDTLVRFGLDSEFKRVGIDIRQGPGCPVCVTPPGEIEEILALARTGLTVAVFGDVMKVPGTRGCLNDAKAEGADVRVVFGVDDAVVLARKVQKEVVFMGIGFETTAPTTASALLSDPPVNFSVLSCHRTVPPALEAIAEMGEIKLDGMIQPGHVSTIIGTRPYEFLSKKYGIPQVVAGFEPIDLLMGVYMLAVQAKEGRAEVQNEYTRVVHTDGNPTAIKAMKDAFEPVDVPWRGFPVIKESGLAIRKKLERHDAGRRFEDLLEPIRQREYSEAKGCRCGEMLRGILTSEECPLFAKKCTPSTPIGPCMVSREGNCHISYRYAKKSQPNGPAQK
ncbi:MAG: hydrogenase formation protein HypD [Thermoplasmatota archaeon]|nr:hydrogenase formation protein HypD [Candidatus Thermoplasmatota archaeon]MBU1914232.1 hydrogenase formation protein HypD [Candidatus Thermoplasmatota archaeon]